MLEQLYAALAFVQAQLSAAHALLDLGRGFLFEGGDYAPEIFLGLTLVLGGSGAWATGRALAGAWQPLGLVPAYVFLLAAAVRFLHFALFEEELLAPLLFAATFLILLALALLGYRATRAGQMGRQYSWAFARRGLFGWRRAA